ncbi:hypothetical protein Tco_1334956 [Tanacetum coccineum]
MAFKSISKKRRGRRVSITISMSDDEEQQKNKRKKKLHDRPSKTAKSKERPCEQIFEADRGMEVEGEKNNQEMEVDLEKTDAHNIIDAVDRDKQGASRLKDVNKSECTDWAKHSKISALTPKTFSSFDVQFDPGKVISTMEEPSSVLSINDIPSFDLGLTPTPPDVNVNADKQDVSNKEPILDIVPLTFTRIRAKLRLPQKKAKDQESTTIASATTASNTTKFEVVSNSVEDRSLVLLLNDASSFDLGLTSTPPYVNLHTDTQYFFGTMVVDENLILTAMITPLLIKPQILSLKSLKVMEHDLHGGSSGPISAGSRFYDTKLYKLYY